jgi:hypothetical protein
MAGICETWLAAVTNMKAPDQLRSEVQQFLLMDLLLPICYALSLGVKVLVSDLLFNTYWCSLTAL